MSLALERLEGKYKILDKLGEGGMGAVYKVRHLLLDEVRVIKVMRSALAGDEELEARFLREARVATRLRHPNIAQLYDFTITEDGTAYIVLEFIDGLTLEELLKRHGPPPIAFVLEICLQSLRAVEYLHRQQFVHRDISPDNLMLSRDVDGHPHMNLIDLGIAKTLEAGGGGLTATGMFLGKVRYTSPEQLEAKNQELDGRSDLYSFGVVLYELLTGQCPIEGTSPPAMIAGHLFRPPRSFEETDPDGRVPPELRKIVLHMLAKRPEDRVRNARALSQQLATLRVQYPLVEKDTREILDGLFAVATLKPATERPGTTQDRLDERFGAHPTPPRREGGAADGVAARATLVREETGPTHALPGSRTPADAQRVEILFSGARKLVELGQDEAARQQLEALRTIDPENSKLLTLLREIKSRTEERRRAEESAALARAVEQIESEIDAGRLQSAEHLLGEVITSYGTTDALIEMRQRLDRRVEESHRVRVEQLLTEASRLGDVDDFEQALNELEQVLQLDPANRKAQSLLATYRNALERQVRESRRQESAQRVDSLLERGELDEAQKQLQGAVAEFGPEGALAELRQRIEELLRLEKIEGLLTEARRRAERDDHRQAVDILEEALELAPDHAQVRKLLVGSRQALEQQEKERLFKEALAGIESSLADSDFPTAERRIAGAIDEHGEADDLIRLRGELENARELATAATGIEEALLGECWEEAAELLAAARKRFPGDTSLEELGNRLENTRRQSLERQAGALLEEARRKLETQDFDAALADLRQASELAPSNRAAKRLGAKVEKARQRDEKRRRRSEALEQARGEVGDLIEAGRLGRAAEALRAARKSLGKDAELAKLSQRLEDEKGRHEQQRELEAAIDEAHKLYEGRCFDAALRELEQACRLDPEDPRVAELRKQIEQTRTIEDPKIGEPDAEAAVFDTGKTEMVRQGPASPTESTVRLDADRTVQLDMDRTVQLRREPERRKEISGPAETRPGAARVSTEITEDSLPFSATTAEPVEVALKKPVWARIALPFAAACLLIFSLFFFLARSRNSEPSTAESATGIEATGAPHAGLESRPRPVTPAPGRLVLSAIPWGQVTRISNSQGERQPLPGDAYTPVVLSLPPGEYEIEIRNAGFANHATTRVQIDPGGKIRELTTFAEVSVDEFFASLGW